MNWGYWFQFHHLILILACVLAVSGANAERNVFLEQVLEEDHWNEVLDVSSTILLVSNLSTFFTPYVLIGFTVYLYFTLIALAKDLRVEAKSDKV